jgi:MFS transporter, OFA family, oxalate/formate antiporter
MGESNRRGWVVTASGTGINLALGVLYTWSVFKAAIPESWGWDAAQKSDPYAIACLIFALTMIPAGRLQDRIGPRWVATIGGVLTGLGCLLAGFSGSSYVGFVIGFGVFAGAGFGFGYAAATPAAVKWFPPAKTGLIAGLVVAGFGLASVYIAPLAAYLTGQYGVSKSMQIFGAAFLIIVVGLAQMLKNPPADFKPVQTASAAAAAKPAGPEINWKQMIKMPQFWVLWTMYACGSAAGLMVIGSAKSLGAASLGEAAFWVVAVLAVGNASGRVGAGVISDRFGRQWTMLGFFLLQAVVVVSLVFVQQNAVALLLLVFMAGANYGSNLALFPSATKDYFGIKGFGLNYGLMFTAWGVGGLFLPRIAGMLKRETGSEKVAFFIAGGLMILASILTFVSRALAAREKAAKQAALGKVATDLS